MKISVIGLGKLGLPLAACIASKDFEVIGVDINSQIVEKLNVGQVNIYEPGLEKLIEKHRSKIKATTDAYEAVLNTDVTFVVTATPSLKNGNFSLKYIELALKSIAEAIKVKNSYHLVIIVSTVLPGSMDRLKKLIEKYTGKKCDCQFNCGHEFGLCYNPEFIALGSVINDLQNPNFVLIGESDVKSGELLNDFYKKFLDNDAPVVRMNFVNAELTKISLNTFITTKISYANMLAEICEKLPGGNVDVVTSAIGIDSRVGNKYLKGGAAYGGPCFPRDNNALTYIANKNKVAVKLALTTHKINVKQNQRLAQFVLQNISKGETVGVLGLSYKPNTDVIEESPGIKVLEKLIKEQIKIIVYDPISLKNIKKVFGDKIIYAKDINQCIKNSNLLLFAMNWPEFKNVKFSENEEITVIDPWRIFKADDLPVNIKYLPLGIHIRKTNGAKNINKKVSVKLKNHRTSNYI